MAEVVPDTCCERCHDHGVRTEWDDDVRKYVRKCQLCGRVQESVPATREGKVNEPKEAVVTGNGRAKPTFSTAIATKPDSAAAKALETYHVATTRYLEAGEQLRVDEQRAAEAQARAKSTAERLAQFRVQMQEARSKLDSELALLTPAGEPKPFSQRVKVREGSGHAKHHERACVVCGATFQAAMPTAKYCSGICRSRGQAPRTQPEPAADAEISAASMLAAAELVEAQA